MNINDILKILDKDKKFIIAVVLSITFISAIYAFLIATPYYKSEVNFYQKKEPSSFNSNLSVMKAIEKQIGLTSNDKSFNIFIPDLIYNSDIIIDKLIVSDFQILDSDKKVNLFDFWNFNNSKLETYLLKKKIRKSMNINIDDESGLITISIETEDSILSSELINFIVIEIENFISNATSSHYRELKDDISDKLVDKLNKFNNSENKLKNHMLKYSNLIDDPNIQFEREKLKREAEFNYELYKFHQIEFEKAENLEKDNTQKLLIIKDGTPPFIKSSPKRLLILVLSFITSLFSAIYFLLIRRKFA